MILIFIHEINLETKSFEICLERLFCYSNFVGFWMKQNHKTAIFEITVEQD